MKQPNRMAIYARKSKLTSQGDSIDNQIEMCKEYIQRNFSAEELEINVYEDEGISGKTLDRPAFKSMMKEEQNNPYDYIVVYKLDRISRSVGDFADLIEKFNSLNTSFISVTENFDTSTPIGRAMMSIAAVFAQLERETIAERIKDNMYQLAKIGHWTGGTPPLGYISVKHDITDGNKTKSYHTLQSDDDNIDTLILIFNKYEELHSLNGVEKYLNDNHYKTSKGKEWKSVNIKRILSNPVYCIADTDAFNYFNALGCNVSFGEENCSDYYGIMPYNRYAGQQRKLQDPKNWLITISTHNGILTGKEWIKIQNLLEKYSQERIASNPISILTGILFCKCGSYMRPKRYKSGNHSYICSKKNNGKQYCDNDNVSLETLDSLVLNEVFSYNIDGSSINRQFAELRKKIDNIEGNIANKIKNLRHRKSENEKAIKNIITNMTKGLFDENTLKIFNDEINRYKEENDSLDIKISELEDKNKIKSEMNDNVDKMENAIEYLRDNFDSLSINNKRYFIKNIIEKVIWDGETVNIYIKGNDDNSEVTTAIYVSAMCQQQLLLKKL